MKNEGSFIGYPHFTLVYSDCSVFHFSKIALPSSLSQKLIMSGSKVLTNASITSSDMPEIISDGLLISATEIYFCSPFFCEGDKPISMDEFIKYKTDNFYNIFVNPIFRMSFS